MSRTSTKPSTRSSVPRLTLLGFVVGVTFLAAPGRADEPPNAQPAASVLTLSDGGFLSGTLDDSSQAGKVRWKSPSFESPFEFPIEVVQAIRFPNPDRLARPSGSFGFELTGGDIVYGSVVGLDDKFVDLDVARLGKIHVERSRLRRAFRWRDGADLVYNGPNGLAGWTIIPPAKRKKPEVQQGQAVFMMNGVNAPQPPPKPVVPPGPAWFEEGGQLLSTTDGARIQAVVNLPEQANFELDLSWKEKPDFAIIIGDSRDEESIERAFRIEVWDREIVAYRVLKKTAKLVSIQAVKEGPGRLQVQLFLDQAQGKLIIVSAAGDTLGEINLPETGPGSAIDSVRLVNIHGDIRLERLRIGRWDGETPRPLANDLSRVQLTDLSNTKGQVERFDPATREFVIKGESGELRIPEDKISNLVFAQPDDTTRQVVRAVFQDGTRIGGDWVRVEAGSLVLAAPGIAEPVKLPMDGLRSLDIKSATNAIVPSHPQAGTLEMDGVKLRGHLVNSGDRPGEGSLLWKPLSGESSSAIRTGASGKIVYKTPTPQTQAAILQQAVDRRAAAQRAAQRAAAPQAPANVIGGFIDSLTSIPKATPGERRSLYLRSGDIIPVEVLKIDDKGLTFKTDVTPNSFVPHSRIKAVELATEIQGSIKLNKTKFERLLTLPRMQRDSPPTQLIRSKNGDILRARIVGMDEKMIRVEVRLEEKEIPRDRVSRIIWLHPDETDPAKKSADPAPPPSTNRVQAVRTDGIRLTFNADKFSEDTLLGKSDVLGECRVRMQDLDSLLIGGSVEKEATQLAYQNWKLQNAPDPKSAQMDDEGSPNGGAAGTESSLVGKPAPDFELELVGGGKFHLAENKGKVIVLDFWATWCGPCIQAMPQIDRVTHEFADKGVQLIAVNLQESPEKIKAMLERQKLSPTVALDRDGVVAARYAANAIPQTVVIDREGKITRLFIGGGPKLGDQLHEALQALMPKANP